MNNSTPRAAAISPSFCRMPGIGGDSAANAQPLHAGALERLARLGHDRVDDGLLKARRQVARPARGSGRPRPRVHSGREARIEPPS